MGLAMSRSFGDAAVHTVGGSCVPELTEYKRYLYQPQKVQKESEQRPQVELLPYDLFLILATDGLWDVVDNQQACVIVMSVINKAAASRHTSLSELTDPENPNSMLYSRLDWDPKEAADLLTRFARHRWQSMSSMVDDITCVVIKLTPSKEQAMNLVRDTINNTNTNDLTIRK